MIKPMGGTATEARVAQLQDLTGVLFSKEQLATRVAELGEAISKDYEGKDLVLIGILKGGVVFLSDLSRQITIPHVYDLVGARSYKGGTRPSPQVSITKDLDLPIKGRDVLITEDIYDTGNTLRAVLSMIEMYRPRSVEICALLRKKKVRQPELAVKYVGFEVDDVFVVGYGLDYREHYRHLSYIGILNPEVYE